MNAKTRRLIAAIAPAVIALAAAGAQAHSGDAAFDRLAGSYHRVEAKWVNALLPAASGDHEAVVQSADAAFDRLAGSYGRPEAKWVNALLPGAAGDYVALASADAGFMRQVAYYTREMLDRGGWVNAFVADDHYATGNLLLAAAVGEGVTGRAA